MSGVGVEEVRGYLIQGVLKHLDYGFAFLSGNVIGFFEGGYADIHGRGLRCHSTGQKRCKRYGIAHAMIYRPTISSL